MNPALRRAAPFVTTLVLLAGTASPARAQTPVGLPVRGRVVLIAGADLHIELLAAVTLQPGDTLVVQRGATERGRLHVLAADSVRAVVGFVAAPFPLTRGEVLEAELRSESRDARRPAVAAAPASDAAVAPAASAASAAVAAPVAGGQAVRPASTGAGSVSARRIRTGPQVAGHLASDTRWVHWRSDGGSVSYAVPAATVSMRITGLPNGSSLRVFGQIEHHGASSAPVGHAGTEVRMHTVRLETAAGPVRLALGRLTSDHDAASGAWDGVSIATGRAFSVAAEVGYEPERAGAAPSTAFPRIGVSAQAMTHAGDVRYRGSIGAVHYLREAPAHRGNSAIVTRHTVSAGAVRLAGDARVEMTDSGAAVLRWGGVRASVRAGGYASVRAGFRRYTPFLVTTDTIVFQPRDRVEAGGTLTFGSVALSLDAGASPGAADRARSVSGQLTVQRLPGDLALALDGGVWEYGVIRTTTSGAAFSRISGRIYTRAGYRFERSVSREALLAHELEGDISLTLARGSSIGIAATHSTAGAGSGSRVQLRLMWGF